MTRKPSTSIARLSRPRLRKLPKRQRATIWRLLYSLFFASALVACGGGGRKTSHTTNSHYASGGTGYAQSTGSNSGSPHRSAPTGHGYGGGGDEASDYSGVRSAESTSAPTRTAAVEKATPSSDYRGNYDDGSDSIAEESRPGLGTVFGEQQYSQVKHRAFRRASSRPFASVAIHYNNAEGIAAQSWSRGVDLRDLQAATDNGGISISLTDEYGRLLQGGSAQGRTYVVGHDGQRYFMQLRNHTGGTFEVVASVDGLDVVDGRPASMSKRGYILEPYGTLRIEGFRTSEDTVAAFRFGAVSQSYAAKTSGDRNVGVIGFAFFAEKGSRWTSDEIERRETADPFPGDYARPPVMIR